MAIEMLRPGDNKRDILVFKFELEHEDVYHLKNFYKRVYEWLYDEGYVAADDPAGKDFNYESLYWERTKADESKEHQIWWRGIDVPRGNSYYRYFMKIDFQTLYVKKIEIMHKGQKFGTNKADVIVRVEAWLQLDYKNSFQKHGLLKYIDKWFIERFYLADWQKYKEDLYLTSFRLHTAMKQFLEFKMTTDWGRPFHAERGTYHAHEKLIPPSSQ